MKNITIKTISFLIAVCAFFSSCASSGKPGGSPVSNTVTADAEYQRSKGSVDVSEKQFAEDKTQILIEIKRLERIMANMDFESWYTYLDSESIDYWSKKSNLQRAASRLPVKGLKLNSLQDYFKFVFVPARSGRTIDEIRYETKNEVKVVQFQEESDKIYYNFQRVDDKWKLHLPPLDD